MRAITNGKEVFYRALYARFASFLKLYLSKALHNAPTEVLQLPVCILADIRRPFRPRNS